MKKEDLEILSLFALEGIIVHVLCVVFSPVEESAVRVASLIDRLETCVRRQASFCMSNMSNMSKNGSKFDDSAFTTPKHSMIEPCSGRTGHTTSQPSVNFSSLSLIILIEETAHTEHQHNLEKWKKFHLNRQ